MTFHNDTKGRRRQAAQDMANEDYVLSCGVPADAVNDGIGSLILDAYREEDGEPAGIHDALRVADAWVGQYNRRARAAGTPLMRREVIADQLHRYAPTITPDELRALREALASDR